MAVEPAQSLPSRSLTHRRTGARRPASRRRRAAAAHAAGPRDRRRRRRQAAGRRPCGWPDGEVPAIVGSIDTVAGLAIAAGAAYFLVQSLPAGQAAAALAGSSQADPLLHLHRLRAGAADRRLLRARRAAPLLQFQLLPACRPRSDRSATACGCSRPARRARAFNATANAAGAAMLESRAGRAAVPISRALGAVVPVAPDMRRPASPTAHRRGRLESTRDGGCAVGPGLMWTCPGRCLGGWRARDIAGARRLLRPAGFRSDVAGRVVRPDVSGLVEASVRGRRRSAARRRITRARLRRDIGVDLLGATVVDVGTARPLPGRIRSTSPAADRPGPIRAAPSAG